MPMLRRSPRALFRVVGDDVYVTAQGRSFDVLSGSAAAIWVALENGSSLTELVRTLAGDHRVRPEAIESEVRSFVSELQRRAWVEEVGR
jgi:hypothetical protein